LYQPLKSDKKKTHDQVFFLQKKTHDQVASRTRQIDPMQPFPIHCTNNPSSSKGNIVQERKKHGMICCQL
jgi:hypothetical protein